MCDHCMPLEPFDAGYQAENKIKHLSFHAYLRKLTPKGAQSSTSELPPLSPLSYKVTIPCPSGHAPWPEAICTQCQPSAITLQPQPFRAVDHLEVATPAIIDRFLSAWRSTGMQRFGWLLGRYAPHDAVPLGIKAVVEAIHEPPQQGELDGLTLGIPWEDEPRIRALAAAADPPLQLVGYIFTDLTPSEEDRTTNVYKRHPGSFFLSSLEAVFAATIQNQNPTKTRASTTGTFASRMVTTVLTATEDGQVDLQAYQMSEQACALVAADLIEPSVDPNIVRVKTEERTEAGARYVPDVFFRYKNEYGLEVKKSAKPAFPVEYLLVNVTHGFPQAPAPVFRSVNFPIENRQGMEDASIEKAMSQLAQINAPDVHDSRQSVGDTDRRIALANWISDWHLIAFLGSSGLFSEEDLKILLQTAVAPNLEDPTVLDRLISTGSWQTLMTFTRETHRTSFSITLRQVTPTNSDAAARQGGGTSRTLGDVPMDEDIPPELLEEFTREEGGASTGAGTGGGGGGGGIRICPHCTFENTHGGTDCEICGLPLEG
jgi:nuclear protein localization family protein 4